MSEPNLNELVTFDVSVDGEHAGFIHLMPEAEALVAAMKSNPTITFVPNDSVG
jgi:hypothetical protein